MLQPTCAVELRSAQPVLTTQSTQPATYNTHSPLSPFFQHLARFNQQDKPRPHFIAQCIAERILQGDTSMHFRVRERRYLQLFESLSLK